MAEDLLINCARMIVRIREADQGELDDLEGDIRDEIERLADQVGELLDYPIGSPVNSGLNAPLPSQSETTSPRSPL